MSSLNANFITNLLSTCVSSVYPCCYKLHTITKGIRKMTSVKFAVIDVNDFLSKKQAAEPDLAADWAKLEELYNKKLWHQLTLKLQDFVKNATLQADDNLIQLYNNFLTVFENKINPLSLVEIVSIIVEQFKDKKEAIAFLEKIETKVKINDEALAFCKVLQGQIYLEKLNDLDSTEKIIDQLEGTLEDADGVTPVHGRFYKLASEYYRVRGPMSRYYRCALRYVGMSCGGAELPPEERRRIALSLALAALIAEDVYDLDELLAHPIIESLAGSPNEWAAVALRAAARGDVAAYERVTAQHPHPDLARASTTVRTKIALLCLIQMAFNKTSAQRKLTFSEIAREARLPADEVELLVMKALAEKLVRGHIDQVSSTAYISWVRPRALPREGVAALAGRLDAWCAAVAGAAHLLASQAPDLITAWYVPPARGVPPAPCGHTPRPARDLPAELGQSFPEGCDLLVNIFT